MTQIAQISAPPIAGTAHPLSTTIRRPKSWTTFAAENVSGVAENLTFFAEIFSAAHVPLSATAEAPVFTTEKRPAAAETFSAPAEARSATAESLTFATESRSCTAETLSAATEKLSGAAETFSALQSGSLSHRDSSASALYGKTAF